MWRINIKGTIKEKGVLPLLISLFAGLFCTFYGHSQDLSGEWLMQIGNGTKNSTRIQQTNDQLVVWMQFNGELWTFTGEVTDTKIKITRPLDNKWELPEEKECHRNISGQLEQYPQYAFTIELDIQSNRITGDFVFPKRISCEDGISITLSEPISVKLTPVNYFYWASKKYIFKAPTNNPELKDTVVIGDRAITDLALDNKAERIYWAEGKKIFSANQKGKSKRTITEAEEDGFSPHSLVVDNKKKRILWAEGFKIMSTPLKSDFRQVVLEERLQPRSLAIDSTNQKLYWIVEREDKIRRANLDGSGAEDFKTQNQASDISIDDKKGWLYYNTFRGIHRIPLKGTRTIEDVFLGLEGEQRDIFYDKSFNRIYWVQSAGLSKTIKKSGLSLSKPRQEDFMETYTIYDLCVGPKGPSSYEEVKIKGSFLVEEAPAGKSLLQGLVKDDIYYQVLLSEYAQQESEFNLTDTRLLLIWGENFPRRNYRGNNIVFTSSDPKVTYQEFDTWSYRLGDKQKEKYSDYPLWLAKNDGIKTKTWNRTWQKLKDSLGQSSHDSIKEMDHMLVLATPKKGILPGPKNFTMNDAPADWYMTVGNTLANMRFLRILPSREEETITSIYAGDPFYIEITTSQDIGQQALDLSYFVDNAPLRSESIQLRATAYGNDKKIYRTPSISLHEFSENGGQLQLGMSGNAESVCKVGSVFTATITNSALFNNGAGASASAPMKNPLSSVWHQMLGEAVVLANLSIAEEDWEKSITKPVATFTNMDLSAIPSGGITSSCSVTLGDYAAMILLRRRFVEQMETYFQSLNRNKDNAAFQYGYWEMMAPQMANEGFPLGNIEVTDDEIPLRNAFSKAYILENYSNPDDARRWIKAAKKDGFIKYLNSVEKSLNASKAIKDTETKKLLDLTGFGFKNVIDLTTPDLQMKKYPTENEFSCQVVPHSWTPDKLGRSSVRTMNNSAEHCRANEEFQSGQIDFALAMAGALTAGTGYLFASAKLGAAVIGAALGSGELIRDNIKFNAEDEEVNFSEGTYGVLGSERYAMAKLKVTPTWARMLSYFGGGLGVAGDALDILKVVRRVDMASAYKKLPAMLGDIDSKGALGAYEAMSQSNKARFLLLLGEAEELKKLPVDQLTDAQRRLLSVAEQFTNELDVAVKSKNAIGEAGEAVADLTEGLPSDLKNDVPVIRDNSLTGNTVHLEYKVGKYGFIEGIVVRAGKTATAQHIAEHGPTLLRMKQYEAVASRASTIYRKIRHWYRRIFKEEPPLGSNAWESMQEVKKLNQIIEGRINGVVNGVEALNPRSFADEIAELTQQLNKHQKAFEEFVSNPAYGRGFIAATNEPLKKFKKEVDDYIANLRTPVRGLQTAGSKRMAKAKDLLNQTTEGKQLYDAVVEQALKQNADMAMVGRFLERLAYLEDLIPDKLPVLQKFIATTGNVEAITLLMRRGTPSGREFIKAHYRKVMNDVLEIVERSSGDPEALNGIATYLMKIGRGRPSAVDDLFLLSKNFDANTFPAVLGCIHKVADVEGFRQLLSGLSAYSGIKVVGAIGHLNALTKLVQRYDPSQLVLEVKVWGALWGDNYRNIDIVIKKGANDFDILEIVEVKEYQVLEGLFDFKIKRQFAKDVMIAHVNGLSLTNGVRWMVSKAVLNGNALANKQRLQQSFLRAFDNERLKEEVFCNMPPEAVKRFRKELEDNFDKIFEFF